MKREIVLFNVYDEVGETFINERPTMATSVLTAAVAYYNTFIKEKDPIKNPYDNRTLKLCIQGILVLSENGEIMDFNRNYAKDYKSVDIIPLINKIMAERGIDDYIIDEAESEENE